MTPIAPITLAQSIDEAAAAIEAQVIAWRRDLHQHPELGNREFRTAGILAEHYPPGPWRPTRLRHEANRAEQGEPVNAVTQERQRAA